MAASPLILNNVTHIFRSGEHDIKILDEACLDIRQGELVALIAPSGTGKSTLLQIAGLLARPTHGEIILNGHVIGDNEKERTKARCHNIGFVYQSHNLLSEFTALENVVLPQLAAKKPRKHAEDYAITLLRDLGLEHRLHTYSGKLSGGEKQRVAIARALANKPSLLLADEPTGNLDETNADHVFNLFISMAKTQKTSALIATHNTKLAEKMDRILFLRHGKLYSEQERN